ncbi:CopG family transcripitonal regulator [Sphingobium sp. C100]|uniref:CopG family transcriptional regulator n=1 Tax=Sphingobium sp. C100 TaxID=1207055 RepID=UPI0003D5DC7B|nr:CopG family transcriptional regulator [Sphingobium sp. C100]ETI64962.1 CopG family transcripitonal regulator [Sphingobium sp. C100]
MSRRTRLNIFLEPDHARRLKVLAATKGVSQSGVIAAALASFLSSDGADRREAAIAKRLDRIHHLFERVERDQTILIETLALFVRLYLATTTPLGAGQQDAARAQGRARFQEFIEQLGRHLQRGNSLVRQVHEEVFADDASFVRLDDVAEPNVAEHLNRSAAS